MDTMDPSWSSAPARGLGCPLTVSIAVFSRVWHGTSLLEEEARNAAGWLKFDKVPSKPLPDRAISELLDHAGPEHTIPRRAHMLRVWLVKANCGVWIPGPLFASHVVSDTASFFASILGPVKQRLQGHLKGLVETMNGMVPIKHWDYVLSI